MIKLSDVKKEDLKLGKELIKKINHGMLGRVCMTSYIEVFYAVKEFLGESCRNYVEIGVLHGGSLCMMLQSKYPSIYVGIDVFNYYGRKTDPFSKPPIAVSKDVVIKNVKKYNKHKYKVHILEGKSCDKKILKQVNEVVKNDINLLLIDGDHTFSGVVDDFKSYSPMVSSNGIVIFDNYGDNHWRQVKDAVDSLSFNGFNVVGRHGNAFIVQKN